MINFTNKLEALIKEEREKMIGKAILYAENSEASNRNGYMTHKYAASIIKGIIEEYNQELNKLLEKREKEKQDKLVSDKVTEITLMKEQKTKERAETSSSKKKDMETSSVPTNDSVEKKDSKVVRKKSSPKKSTPKKRSSGGDK